jgi:hypothetical protein
MNSNAQTCRPVSCFRRLAKRLALGLWIVLAWCPGLFAADDYYINNAIVSYPGTWDQPPDIHATNFVNNSIFTINYTILSDFNQLYETWDTRNYTNNDTLVCNTGFRFDTQSTLTGLRSTAGNFYNPGAISCGSANNIGDIFGGLLFFLYSTMPQCIVSATNIVNPGLVDVGVDGLIRFAGKNVDLTRASLNIEGAPAGTGYVNGSGVYAVNTNYWDPSFDLATPFAESAYFPVTPNYLYLTNAVSYYSTSSSANYNTVWGVVIQDTSPANVSYNVYFHANNGLGIGNGEITVEWVGTYLDAATGDPLANYLYMNVTPVDVTGIVTNHPVTYTGVPFFNEITESLTQIPLGVLPSAQSIYPFPVGAVTNAYNYLNAKLVATTVDTNGVANHSVTNLPGRLEISASSTLDLAASDIIGLNYMSLQSSNQFNGSSGANIQAAYSDLNLGVTNGFLSVSNVMQSAIPVWNGTIQAWTTRWLDTTSTPGVTNDYRIVVIGSQVSPTTMAQVQDLILHATNSLTISDTMNVMRTFYSDARSLTLTTNPAANGATSLDGELNLQSPAIFWQSSVPNLRFLTNNGAIRMQNLAYFGAPLLTNVTGPVAAAGVLSKTAAGTNAVKNDKVTIGSKIYTFVPTLTNTVANQVKWAADLSTSLNNLISAINAGSGAGTAFSSATTSNASVTAGPLVGNGFAVTARTAGTSGNSVTTKFTPATTSSNLTWGGHSTLYGGALSGTNVVPFIGNTAFINRGIFMDQGSIIYAGNFLSTGIFSNGVGSFTLKSLTTTLTNGSLYAAGDVAITADTILTSNLVLEADRSLTLTATNLLTDTGPNPTNLCFWAVGTNSVGYGISVPVKPAVGSLLGTTITLVAPTNRQVLNVWPGSNRGLDPAGYDNNMAVGRMVMDAKGISSRHGTLVFNGAGSNNALYVDELVLEDFSTQGNATNSYNFPWLQINTNMMIYFAQAILTNGISVARLIDQASLAGANGGGRLRWIYSYAGYYSSTNLTYTNADGTVSTNTVNAALAQDTQIDSDGDGIPNASDPTPFLLPSETKFTATVTNLPPKSVKVQWAAIPNATNYIYFKTNLLSPNWLAFTNFKNWYYGSTVAKTNSAHVNYFRSPQAYVLNPSLPDNSQQTNVWVYDAITNGPRYFRVVVWPVLNLGE